MRLSSLFFTLALTLLTTAILPVRAQDARPMMVMTCQTENEFALTFDDGPSEFTAELLQTLDVENVQATFFVLGVQVDNPEFQAVFRDVYARGHQIAAHTYDHPHLNTLPADQIISQLNRTDQAIRRVIGISPSYMRPPFGECSEDTQKIIQGMGYTIVQWNLDSNDWTYADQGPSAQAMVTQNFITELAKATLSKIDGIANVAANAPGMAGSAGLHLQSFISLQHDIQGFSVRQTRRIIQEIKKKGYRFVSVAECAGNLRKPMYSNAPDSIFKGSNSGVTQPAPIASIASVQGKANSAPTKSKTSAAPVSTAQWHTIATMLGISLATTIMMLLM